MSPELQNLITRIAQAAKTWHAFSVSITDADVLLNDAPAWAAQLTPEAIAAVPSFAAVGLTVADVLATLYILKLMNVLPSANDYPAFVKMANMR